MMKWIAFTILLFLTVTSNANMASPFWNGTRPATVICSNDIRILKEYIHIHINKEFSKADFDIEYNIETDTEGLQIPLLFVALNYTNGFKVWVDGKATTILDVPKKYTEPYKTPFNKFSDAFGKTQLPYDDGNIEIYFSANDYTTFSLNDLKYFEASLKKGLHTIRLKYSAAPDLAQSDWINKYSFHYSLSPAKFWKSFGTLDINIEQESPCKNLSVVIGNQEKWMKDSLMSLSFHALPGEFISINFNPELNSTAKNLIAIHPLGMMIILGIILSFVHIKIIIRYRKRHLSKRYSIVAIIGSIIFPFIILISFILFHTLIDFIIGPYAGKHHGYIFLIMLFYPVLMPVYWLAMWLIDRTTARRLRRQH